MYTSAMWVLMIWLATMVSDERCAPTRASGAVFYEGVVQTADQRDKTEPISREAFLATEWRFGAEVIPAPRGDGFPLTFRADGSLERMNMSGINRWSLDDGILELSSSNSRKGERSIRFEWGAPGVFRSCSRTAMLIAPKPIFAKEWKEWSRPEMRRPCR
jgi:hypothetical protein